MMSSSALVSSYLEHSERFQHNSIQAREAAICKRWLEVMTQARNDMINPDLPASLNAIPANGAGKLPISRRHSSSMFGSNASKSVSLTPFADTGFYNPSLGGPLETVNEETYRDRAYSEGSSILSNESLLEQQQQQASGSSRYKTELCRPFEENGKCKYGDKCQFAHGKHELRHMVRHPKYKTELCRTYHTSGLCPYGPRCHFIHNQDEPTVGMQRQAAMNAAAQLAATVPMSVANIPQRQSNVSRPSNLQLMSQQRAITRLNSCSYSPPLETPSPFFGPNDNSVLSPLSPLGTGLGQMFNYGKHPLSPVEMQRSTNFGGLPDNRLPSPPLSQFSTGHLSDLSLHDDVVFDGPPTPPDSDRESATGSPPGFAAPAAPVQRLPIFRCLSQSE